MAFLALRELAQSTQSPPPFFCRSSPPPDARWQGIQRHETPSSVCTAHSPILSIPRDLVTDLNVERPILRCEVLVRRLACDRGSVLYREKRTGCRRARRGSVLIALCSKGGTRVAWTLGQARTDELVIRIRRRGEHPQRGDRFVFVWVRGTMGRRLMESVEVDRMQGEVVVVREETGALGPGP
jgi:hypothetical protein